MPILPLTEQPDYTPEESGGHFPDAGRYLSCLRDPAFLADERRRVKVRATAKRSASGLGTLLRAARMVRRQVTLAVADALLRGKGARQ